MNEEKEFGEQIKMAQPSVEEKIFENVDTKEDKEVAITHAASSDLSENEKEENADKLLADDNVQNAVTKNAAIEKLSKMEESNLNSSKIEEQSQTSEAERGVSVGKFKSVDDLIVAYNNLQAEFTRKSQKLAELQKLQTQPSLEEQKAKSLETFLSKNQEAAVYAEELSSRVGSQQTDVKAFENAWAGLLYEKLTSSHKVEEPIIQNLIQDDEIQNMVIKNYVEKLQKQKTPIVMSSRSGERVTKTVTPKPDSFEAAKKVALDVFSNF